MLDLALAVACSLGIGMIFKYAAREGMDRLALLTVNYAVAFAAGALLVGPAALGGLTALPAGLVGMGVATGALFIAGFFLLSLATEVAGMSLALGVMRVSVVVPFLASWWLWGEVPSPAQGAGLATAGAAFFLIARRPPPGAETSGAVAAEAGKPRAFGVLALLFVVGGVVDVLLKAFDETYAAVHREDVFLLLLFAVACVLGGAGVVVRGVRRGTWPAGRTMRWGAALGAVNYASAKFLLRAIRVLSGPFVFPANNIAVVIGAALLGVFVWGEHLSRTNRLGIALAAVALVLLGIGR